MRNIKDPDFTKEFELLPSLKRHARVDLGMQRTRLELLPNLSAELNVRLFVKRDDCLSFALGGNKIRQLEYYLGPAKDIQADTILITGAVQSNFVRLCAAACRKLGWHPIVQLEKRVPNDNEHYNSSGNVLLNNMLGAEVHYFDEGENEAAADANLDMIADRLSKQGKKPYVIHLGVEHLPLGALGYALAAAEVFLQFKNQGIMPDHIVIPSGSGLTHAGFLCGARAIGWDVQVHGICVRRNKEAQISRITGRAKEIDKMLDKIGNVRSDDIHVSDSVLAPGYGQLNADVKEAIRMAAHHEGLLLDPVYSGRAFAGLASLVRNGTIAKNETVTFIHTGGLAAVFAYHDELASMH